MPTSTAASAHRPAAAGRAVWYLLGVVAVGALYAVAGHVGIVVSYFQSHVTLIWPPTGIAVGVLFRFGHRYWPGVFLGALAVEASALPFGVAAGVAAGNTLAPAAAAWALRWLGFRPAVESQADILRLMTAGAFAPMLVSATNGMACLCWGEVTPWSRFWDGWWVWWVGDAVGVLIFAPIVLALPRTSPTGRVEPGLAARAAAAAVASLGVSVVCFGSAFGDGAHTYPLPIFPGLVMLWVASRYGLWAGSVCGAVIAAVAVWNVSHGVGWFYSADVSTSLIHLWGYLTGLSAILLLMTSVISGRDAAARRLAASEELYRTLVEENPAMICQLGPDGVVTYVNETYCRVTRQPAAAVLGRPLLDGCAAEDRRRLTDALDTSRRGSAPVVLEVLAPGGRLRWHKWKIRAVAGSAGAPPGFQAVGLDVTDLRRAEEERRAIEEQMFHTQKLESLGVMAGGVAHDFNNLLTGIIGHAELAADDSTVGPACHTHLTRVVESARRAADLTRQLLVYTGKGARTMRPLDLNAVIRDTTALVGVSIPRKCALRFEPGREPAWVSGDEVQLRQVVMNLLINAGEAVGDRPGVIRVRTDVTDVDAGQFSDSLLRSSVAAGRYTRLRVSDTGCGMDAATQAKIFEPFFTTKFTGRGLGLAAVHGIVRSHGGTVQVVSEPGQGTEFTVLLPWHAAAPECARETPAEIRTPVPARLPSPACTGSTILVIDDDDAVLAVAREVLEHAGWDVAAAASGRDGLDVFCQDPSRFRLLLIDMTMPDLNGLETLAEVRRVRADVPVILCTGYGSEAIPDLAPYAPARPLNKPFRTAELLSAVASMSGIDRAVAQSASRQ